MQLSSFLSVILSTRIACSGMAFQSNKNWESILAASWFFPALSDLMTGCLQLSPLSVRSINQWSALFGMKQLARGFKCLTFWPGIENQHDVRRAVGTFAARHMVNMALSPQWTLTNPMCSVKTCAHFTGVFLPYDDGSGEQLYSDTRAVDRTADVCIPNFLFRIRGSVGKKLVVCSMACYKKAAILRESYPRFDKEVFHIVRGTELRSSLQGVQSLIPANYVMQLQ